MDSEQELYLNALLGGVLLGLAAATKTWFTGGVLGCSGALKSVAKLNGIRPVLFTLGMVAASFLMRLVAPDAMVPYRGLDLWALYGGGLLIGVGTYSANGCTSGHGITGMTRLSRRSIVSTLTFFVSGVLTATFADSRAFISFSDEDELPQPVPYDVIGWGFLITLVTFSLIAALRLGAPGIISEHVSKCMTEFVAGAAFASGLVFSGMNRPSTVLSFLDLRAESWNAALALVLCGAILTKGLLYHKVTKRKDEALLGGSISLPCRKRREDAMLLYGSMLFGIGWGLTGICPGPGMTMLALEDPLPGVAMISGLMTSYIFLGLYDSNKDKIERFLQPTTAGEPPVAKTPNTCDTQAPSGMASPRGGVTPQPTSSQLQLS